MLDASLRNLHRWPYNNIVVSGLVIENSTHRCRVVCTHLFKKDDQLINSNFIEVFFRVWSELNRIDTSPPPSLHIAIRAPRIISYLQGLSGHEKAAEEAAEQESLISTIDEIS